MRYKAEETSSSLAVHSQAKMRQQAQKKVRHGNTCYYEAKGYNEDEMVMCRASFRTAQTVRMKWKMEGDKRYFFYISNGSSFDVQQLHNRVCNETKL